MNDLAGVKAVVTGGASGIGAATVTELIGRGARVAIIDREVPSQAQGSLSISADICSEHEVESAIAEISGQLGGIDVLINNAGIGASGTVLDNSSAEWHRVFDVNVFGAARVTRHAMPLLRRSNWASIVNIASVAGVVGLRNRALYSATKGALIALTYAMAADHVDDGIRVNAVAPGTADTPWIQRLLTNSPDPAETERQLRARQPIGRLVDPSEVAFTVANLASPRASSTTGTIVFVDGGLTTIR